MASRAGTVAVAVSAGAAALAVYFLLQSRKTSGVAPARGPARRPNSERPAAPKAKLLGVPSALRFSAMLKGDEAKAKDLVDKVDKQDVRAVGDLLALLTAACGAARSAAATEVAKAALKVLGALLEPARKLAKDELEDLREDLYALAVGLLGKECDAELATCVLSVVVDLTKERRKQYKGAGGELGGHPPCTALVEAILAALAQHETDRGVVGRGCRSLSFIFIEPENRGSELATAAVKTLVSAMSHNETGAYVEGCSALKSLARSAELCEVLVRDGGLDMALRAMQDRPQIAEVQWRAIELLYYLCENGQRAHVLAKDRKALALVEACAGRFAKFQRPSKAILQFWTLVLSEPGVKAQTDLQRAREICTCRKYPHDQQRYAFAQAVLPLL